MKIIAVIPVKSRESIISLTIPRLAKQLFKVIVAGHDDSECKICEVAGADFYTCPQEMALGGKWQFLVNKAREYSPDGIIILGSGGVISDDYCEKMTPYLDEFAMVGKAGVHLFDTMRNGKKRMAYWPGYTGGRAIEPQGNGRIFSAKFLDKCNWQIFDAKRNSSLDSSTMVSLRRYYGEIKVVKDIEPIVMRISSWQYPQKDPFDRLIRTPGVKIIENHEVILNKLGL